MTMRVGWRRGVAVMSLAAVLSSGCASVQPPGPGPAPAPVARRTYPEARAAADALWAEYSRRAREQTTITNALYLWLSSVATAIVGLGVTGTSGVPITALGLGGAYGYGAATWFVRPEHLVVYKAGADGVRCIRDKSRPLGSADTYARSLEAAVSDGSALDRALTGLVVPVAALQGTPATGDDATTKAAALDAARDAETAARTIQKNARILVRDLDDAADQMWSAVDTVRTEVEFAIRRNTDPRDVLAHIQQNVLGTYKDLIALGEGQANKATDAGVRLQSQSLTRRQRKQADDLQQKIEAVNLAVTTLASETRHVSGLMEASSIPGVAEGINQCLTAAQTGVAVPRIQVRPTSVTLAPGKSETVLVIGTTHAVLQKLPSSAPFTTTTTVAEGNTSVIIKADDVAPAGEYVLSVSAPIATNDTVERTVRVTVTAAAARPPEPTADVNKLLGDKGWTCGAGKRWTTGPAAGGGTAASIVCDDQAAADTMIKDAEHVKQIAALQRKFPKATVTASGGKAQIVAPEAADLEAFVAALTEALK
jgi:hypothetical protein